MSSTLGTLLSDNWGCWLCPTPFIELLLCSLLTLASSSPGPFEDEHREEVLTVLRLERGSRLELAGVMQLTLASPSPGPFEDEHREEVLIVLRLERGSRLELAGVMQGFTGARS